MQKNISKREDMYNWHVVLPYLRWKYENTFYNSVRAKLKFKLYRSRKFCCKYELQYTHYFFRAKTENYTRNYWMVKV